jgi:hypothetical protein
MEKMNTVPSEIEPLKQSAPRRLHLLPVRIMRKTLLAPLRLMLGSQRFSAAGRSHIPDRNNPYSARWATPHHHQPYHSCEGEVPSSK